MTVKFLKKEKKEKLEALKDKQVHHLIKVHPKYTVGLQEKRKVRNQ